MDKSEMQKRLKVDTESDGFAWIVWLAFVLIVAVSIGVFWNYVAAIVVFAILGWPLTLWFSINAAGTPSEKWIFLGSIVAVVVITGWGISVAVNHDSPEPVQQGGRLDPDYLEIKADAMDAFELADRMAQAEAAFEREQRNELERLGR